MCMSSSWTRMATPAAPSAKPPPGRVGWHPKQPYLPHRQQRHHHYSPYPQQPAPAAPSPTSAHSSLLPIPLHSLYPSIPPSYSYSANPLHKDLIPSTSLEKPQLSPYIKRLGHPPFSLQKERRPTLHPLAQPSIPHSSISPSSKIPPLIRDPKKNSTANGKALFFLPSPR
jgi:hypothetical protein